MGETTEIAWTDSTFNPWIGCQKVSAGCDNCYAEDMMDKRYHRVEWGQRKILGVAGSVGTRIRTAPANWRKPIQWNKNHKAFQAEHGHRQRVFCSSLADVFDNQVDYTWRIDLFDLIGATPELDWLLLTKRPENIEKMLPTYWSVKAHPNVWLGTTCEDQAAFDRRWAILQTIPASIRFISYEPALSDIWLPSGCAQPDWIICGGESGTGYRDMPVQWAAHMAIQCSALEIPFFMKQMAGKKPIPQDLMVREFPR